MIHSERIKTLNARPPRAGRYVLYWMQASQRARCNHALEFAIRRADELNLPVVVGFALMPDYPEANERHFAFMLEGLAETARDLADRGIRLVVRRGRPPTVAARLAADASLVVVDRGYLRHQRLWRRELAGRAQCPVVQVESDVVVPAETACDKDLYAARSFRGRVTRLWDRFLVPLTETRPRRDPVGLSLESIDVSDVDAVLAGLKIDRSVGRVSHYVGGASRARALLEEFLRTRLGRYDRLRNDPAEDVQSNMSPYLHFGQISPLEIGLTVRASRRGKRADKDAYLDQLLVWRELGVNYVLFNQRYDSYRAVPAWARATLHAHQGDRHPHVYTLRQLTGCHTHDPYWNAAMREMVVTGKMHGYMRMYWGKKIIEWTRSPRTAFRVMLMLNNRYFLDGRDPLSYANVAWCFGKHDRPWRPRDVFGTVRYMTASGLERKFDIQRYVQRCDLLARRPEPSASLV
ncbi:MAG: deoxyribodipyrimidine photo-lyase [Planctomycetota bacterium]|jgi:deoxyribodipyrimidine photo-lyase